jgi:hypothetical protein
MNLLGVAKPYGATPSGPVIALTGGEDAAYPLANLYDGRPANPFRFATPSLASYALRFANNLVVDGDMELLGYPTAWPVANAAAAKTNTFQYLGSQSLLVIPSINGGAAYQNVRVDAGLQLALRGAVKAGTGSGSVEVVNLGTGSWLKSDGTWSSTPVAAFTSSAAGWTAMTPIPFQVEQAEAPQTLQIILRGSQSAQNYYFDEVLLVPGINHVSIHGHGFVQGSMWEIASAGSSYWHAPTENTRASGALSTQTPFLAPTMLYEPYFTIRIGTQASWTDGVAPWLGEVVVGQSVDLLVNPGYPFAVEYREPHVRLETSAGSRWVMPRGAHPLRRVTLSFAYATDAEYEQARAALYRMSRGGAFPLVLIPTETNPGTAIFGRLEDATTFRRDAYGLHVAEFIVQEEPFPWF